MDDVSRGPLIVTTFPAAEPFQLCWVVDDLAAAELRVGAITGATTWTRIPNQRFERASTTVDGVACEYDVNVSLAYAGAQQIELIEPVSPTGPYWDWLQSRGPGLHHLGYVVDDVDSAHAALLDEGFTAHVRGTIGDHLMDFAYLRDPALGTAVEIMALSDPMRAMFDSMIGPGYRNPWD